MRDVLRLARTIAVSSKLVSGSGALAREVNTIEDDQLLRCECMNPFLFYAIDLNFYMLLARIILLERICKCRLHTKRGLYTKENSN